MAFLVFRTRIRAHGTTNPRANARLPRPFSFIRTLTVGFGVAPNLLTLLHDEKSFVTKKALAGLDLSVLTAGGDFHPALRTSAARLNGLMGTMPAPRLSSKRDFEGKCAYPPDGTAKRAGLVQGDSRPATSTIVAKRAFDSDSFHSLTRRPTLLWTARALPVDGLGVRLRGFRKSHHLSHASSGSIRRICSDTASYSRVDSRVRINTSQEQGSRRHVPARKHHRFVE
jgi:hypothetical protein